MKQITEYAKNHTNGGNKVTVEIQTNGVFTPEVRKWVLDNVNIIWMSFDGMKDIQNFNRPLNGKFKELFEFKTSAEILEENVRWLNENKNGRNLMVGARVTITDNNVNQQIEMVDYFQSLGIRYVWMDPILYTVEKEPIHEKDNRLQAGKYDIDFFSERYEKDFNFSMDLYLEKYVEAYLYAKQKGLFWGSFFGINFDGESSYHCRSCTPLEATHITPDGYISACDMVVLGEKSYYMGPFIVGKWNEQLLQFDIYQEKVNALLNRKSTNMEHCSSCPAILHCGGYCLGENLNETGSLTGYNPLKCDAVIKLFNELGVCDAYPYLHP